MDWQKYALEYLQKLQEYKAEAEKNGAQDPDCNTDTFVRWECCKKHRALAALDLNVSAMGYALSLVYDIPGPSHFDTALSMVDIEPNCDWRQAMIGSVNWHRALGEKANIEIPEEFLKV